MMQMIKKIGSIELNPPIWWDNYSTSNYFIEESFSTIDGGVLIYRLPLKAKPIILSSGDGQRQTLETKEAVIALSRQNAPTTITDYDDNVIDVEFDHTSGSAVTAASIVEARLSDYWLLKINLRTI